MDQEITIRYLRPPQAKELAHEIEWLCRSLGFISNRDQDKTAGRIFHVLITQKKVRSDDLAQACALTRGAVIHHLSRYLKAGIVVREGRMYVLRMDSLTSTLEEL